MCYSKPGPRCSGHTRTKFRETKAALIAATEDLKARKEALETAKTAEARAELQASEKVLAEAKQAHETATENYENSKAKRAVAMDAYRQARDEYYSSPEGIKKNRQKAVDPSLTEEQREQARQFAVEGQATRNQQKEAYGFQEALREQEAKAVPVETAIPDVAAMTYEEQESLSNSDETDPRILAALAGVSTSKDEGWGPRSEYDYERLRNNIAWNRSTDGITLARLAEESSGFHSAIASHHSTPLSTLRMLALNDSLDSYTAANLVCNPNLPEDEAIEIADAHMTHRNFSTIVGKSSTAPLQIIERIARSKNVNAYNAAYVEVEDALANPRLSAKTIEYAYYENGRSEVVRNPNCPVSIMEDAAGKKSGWTLRSLASAKHAPAHVLRKVDGPETRLELLSNSATPEDIFQKYSQDRDYKIRSQVASSKQTPSSVLASMAAKEKTKAVKDALADNPNFKG